MVSITRITGMATGMDTDSIVKKLMDVEKMSLNKLKQNQQKQLWLIDSYRQWNSDFLSLRTNTLFNMKLSGTYNNFNVESSHSNSIAGTGTSSAIPGTYSIQVKELASSATFIGANVELDSAKTLGVQGLSANTSITLKVTNPTNPVTTQTAKIDISTENNINDVISKINGATDASGKSLGLQAIYDSTLKQFIVKTKNTGETTKIEFNTDQAGRDFLKNTLKISATDTIVGVDANANNIYGMTTSGTDAAVMFNNQEVKTPSNNVTLMGISLTLKSKTVDSSGNPIASTVTVSQNIDTAVKNIKDFVDKYNELIDKMNKATSEAVYRDYLPLTDEQKEDMSEKQIELWESKAKSGLLRGDSILSSMVNKMRSAMNTIVTNGSSYNSLASIGISSKSYQDRGKLYVDEAKLKAAFQANPEGVQKLFSQTEDTTLGTTAGLIERLSDVVSEGIKNLTTKAGVTGNPQQDQSIIGRLLSRMQNDITRQNERLANKENQYYKQFAAMESAVAKFNSQSSWLYSQFNSGM
jgi:flagellar hook-associated protein 2